MHFEFNGNVYKQLNPLAMGYASSNVIAYVLINYSRTKYLSECPPDPAEYRSFYYKRYLENEFILFIYFNQAADSYKFLIQGTPKLISLLKANQ